MSTKQKQNQREQEPTVAAAQFIIVVLVALTVLLLVIALYLIHYTPYEDSDKLADFIIRAIVRYWFMGKW